MINLRTPLAALVAASLIALAGCGSGSDAASTRKKATTTKPRSTTTTTTQPATTTTTTSTTTTTTEPPTTTTTTTTAPPPPLAPPSSGNGLTANQAGTGAWVVGIDQSKLRFNLMPGYEEPGSGFIRPTGITDEYRGRVVAAFNGGFKFSDSHGGFYLGGAEPVPLVDGAASLVILNDGSATIGQWNRDVGMSPNVEAVLQNLHLMVDGGAPTDVSEGDSYQWGPTLSHTAYTPRSGVCVTNDGQVRWVGGPGISSLALANTMVQAGCSKGMELDINPQWVSFAIFDHPDPANPGNVNSHNLYDGMYYGADSYFGGKQRNWIMLTWR